MGFKNNKVKKTFQEKWKKKNEEKLEKRCE